MLKLAGFNSTIYSFNKKTGVSFTPTIVSQRSNPLNKTEIPRKNLPLKMGEKNLNKDFTNTRRGGGVTILRKFFSKFLFFK